MTKRIGGFRRKTRHKLSKKQKDKGKISLRKYFQSFKVGDRVLLNAESAIHNGMYNPKYHSKSATVLGKRGKCYKLEIQDKNKSKTLIVHPVHLRRLKWVFLIL